MKILMVITSHDQLGNTGRKTGFTNGEEEEIGLTKVVPFLVEDEMLKLGAVLEDGKLGRSRRHRRPPDHRTEPAFFRPGREGVDGGAEEESQAGSPGFIDQAICLRRRISA
jgi:hypothetical protein